VSGGTTNIQAQLASLDKTTLLPVNFSQKAESEPELPYVQEYLNDILAMGIIP
jgi:hypothetical protein